jgi:hypothetical protein
MPGGSSRRQATAAAAAGAASAGAGSSSTSSSRHGSCGHLLVRLLTGRLRMPLLAAAMWTHTSASSRQVAGGGCVAAGLGSFSVAISENRNSTVPGMVLRGLRLAAHSCWACCAGALLSGPVAQLSTLYNLQGAPAPGLQAAGSGSLHCQECLLRSMHALQSCAACSMCSICRAACDALGRPVDEPVVRPCGSSVVVHICVMTHSSAAGEHCLAHRKHIRWGVG